MEIAEVIGLLLMLLAFILPALRSASKRRKMRRNLSPEEAARLREEEEELEYRQYEQFLKALGADDDVRALRQRRAEQVAAAEPPPPPPPPPKVQAVRRPKEEFHSSLDAYGVKNRIAQREFHSDIEAETDAYALKVGRSPARIRAVLSRPESLREMVLAKEILDRPRGERVEPHW